MSVESHTPQDDVGEQGTMLTEYCGRYSGYNFYEIEVLLQTAGRLDAQPR